MKSGCLTREQIRLLISGNIAGDEQQPIETHLNECPDCRLMLEDASVTDYPLAPAVFSPTETESDCLRNAIASLKGSNPSRFSDATVFDREERHDLAQILEPPTADGDLGRLGPYRITEMIGRGGMGIVLKGHDTELDRVVAIKVMNPSLTSNSDARNRFSREARAAAVVQHDNLVTIHAVNVQGAVPFIVMEYVDGVSLEQRLAEGPIPFVEIARMAGEIAEGLAAAHARNLVHRDIKPANILLQSGNGRAKITDFGLARVADDNRITRSGVIAGTPEYMSPEQTRGEELDARSDLFSLGLVLTAMVTGTSALRGKTVIDTIRRICDENPAPLSQFDPSLPSWFCELVVQLVEKDPQRRPGSAAAVVAMIRNETAMPVARNSRAMTLTIMVLIAIALLAAGIAGAGAAGWFKSPSPTPVRGDPVFPGEFTIAGRSGSWSSLAEAVAESGDNDVIEIAIDGPIVVEPIVVSGKRLTIRALDGVIPVFVSKSGNQNPFLTSDSGLRLEGVEIHWLVDRGADPSNRELRRSKCAIRINGGELFLERCRILANERGAAISVENTDVKIDSCHFVSSDSPAIYWLVGDNSPVELRNSVIDSRMGLVIDQTVPRSSATRPLLTIDRCTVIGEEFVMLVIDGESVSPVEIRLVASIFDLDRLCHLAIERTQPRFVFPPNDVLSGRMLKSAIDWHEVGNVYDTSLEFLNCSMVFRPRSTEITGPDTRGEWNGFWKLDESAATETSLKWKPRRIAAGELPVLDQAKMAGNALDFDAIGAQSGLVGPRTTAK